MEKVDAKIENHKGRWDLEAGVEAEETDTAWGGSQEGSKEISPELNLSSGGEGRTGVPQEGGQWKQEQRQDAAIVPW